MFLLFFVVVVVLGFWGGFFKAGRAFNFKASVEPGRSLGLNPSISIKYIVWAAGPSDPESPLSLDLISRRYC